MRRSFPFTVADQLLAAGVDLDAEVPVSVRWSVHCDHDQQCRFSAMELRDLAHANDLVDQHLERCPGHRPRISVAVRFPLTGAGS